MRFVLPCSRLAAVALLALMLGACSHLKPRPDLPAGERTIAELSALLAEFDQALADGDFDTAADMLDELRAGIKHADQATIFHRSYARLVDRISSGGLAITRSRRDREARALAGRGQALLARLDVVLARSAKEGPLPDDPRELRTVMAELDGLMVEAEPYRNEAAFRPTIDAFSERRDKLPAAAAQIQWQLDASALLDACLQPRPLAKRLYGDELAIVQADTAVDLLKTCTKEARRLTSTPGYSETAVVKTRLATAPLPELIASWDKQLAETALLAGTLRWKKGVVTIARRVSAMLRHLEAQTDTAGYLSANERAVAELQTCVDDLNATESDFGFDAEMFFKSHLGKYNAPRLREQCGKVRERLMEQFPTLHWRLAAEKVEQHVTAANEARRTAHEEPEAENKLTLLTQSLEELRLCCKEATDVAAISDPAWKGAKPRRAEIRRVQKHAEQCRKLQKEVETLIKKIPPPQ